MSTGKSFPRSSGLIKSASDAKLTKTAENQVPDLTIYDCDGTLIDSERLIARLCLAAIHDLGLSHWSMDQYYAAFVGMPGHVGWASVSKELGKPLPKGLNESIDKQILHLMQTELVPMPGARKAVEAIGGNRCVASSTARVPLVDNIRIAGLEDLFGADIFSATQVRRAKPAPDVFLFAASQMGHDPRHCLVIEDSVPGVLAARRAGMIVVGYTGSAHDPGSMHQRLLSAGAIDVASHMEMLPDIVRRL
jgi:HAD superfamily hydrolase (TIGR01509 family)